MTARLKQLATREQELIERFRKLPGLQGYADYLSLGLKHPVRQRKVSLFEAASDFAEAIENDRTTRRMSRVIRKTGAIASASMRNLPTGLGLTAAQRDALEGLKWVQDGEWIVVVGPCRQATMLGSAIINAASLAGLRPERIKANDWVVEHYASPFLGGVPESCRSLLKTPLLVIDNFARTSADPFQCNMLAQLLEARLDPSPKATLVISPTPVSEWLPMFQCQGTGQAICDMLDEADVIKVRRPKEQPK